MAFSENDYLELFVKGGIVGLLIGDALGYPFLLSTDEIPETHKIDMIPSSQELGVYTHIGSLMICTLASINEYNQVDPEDIMDKFHEFYVGGAYTPNNECFEIDGTTVQSIKNYSNGMPIDRCGLKNSDAKDNNALSRALIIGLYHATDDLPTLVKAAHDVCKLTHNTVTAQVCSALYATIVRNMVTQQAEKVFELLKDYYSDFDKEYLEAIEYIEKWRESNIANVLIPGLFTRPSYLSQIEKFKYLIMPFIRTD